MRAGIHHTSHREGVVNNETDLVLVGHLHRQVSFGRIQKKAATYVCHGTNVCQGVVRVSDRLHVYCFRFLIDRGLKVVRVEGVYENYLDAVSLECL